ncbi:50S ribosomal protein L17 [Candidatus Nomurabacteria bacterium]|uniref:Large ribosomal subunit protein bL17 n=1 Tax=candidate division WWE3 bacterium TaxID=2053526 RepID=A0A955IVV0_UNCKA|nr:50S ribosomal protein L17 [candidate division WWE3 bacterium]MCB9823755.1 50S ribosomal protein L17 [Candidatus Nomurabacteria bacterium]MCB9826839.1 50S ribosomal protein L17 [Candidatus Nomurabacteria bacterium]MCB9827550.1 50S ribosomal protein L17 [Candidatus Nomurabacteria bacterium]HXK52425.1 50S ribosomal protein L17 [bacterium]
MRHRVNTKKMNRDTDHRKALLRNLSASLILHGKVETTLAKAKFVKPYVEKLVTKARTGNSFDALNKVNAKLRSNEALKKLFSDVAPSFEKRPGGYTRIVKLGYRDGDNAPMARLEFVKTKETKTKDSKAKVTPEKADGKKTIEKKTKGSKVSEKSESEVVVENAMEVIDDSSTNVAKEQ